MNPFKPQCPCIIVSSEDADLNLTHNIEESAEVTQEWWDTAKKLLLKESELDESQ